MSLRNIENGPKLDNHGAEHEDGGLDVTTALASGAAALDVYAEDVEFIVIDVPNEAGDCAGSRFCSNPQPQAPYLLCSVCPHVSHSAWLEPVMSS
jgi:hypothetical protein